MNNLLKARQTKFFSYAFVYALIAVAIVIFANVLADRYNKSYDTTSNKRYSLSDQTIKIVKGLKQEANITYFQQSTKFNDAKDQLDMYANTSPKVRVSYVDPEKNPQLARADGITNFGTVLVQIGDKKETAKTVDESGITGAIIRDLKSTTRTICFVTGNGEHQIDDSDRSGYSRLKDLLTKDGYDSKTIMLLQKAEVPGDCTAVVIAGPSSDYQQPEVDAIKNYVENGGRGLFLLDPPLKIGRSEIADNDALTNLLSTWGVTPQKDMILDLNPIGQLAGLGPQVALVTNYDSQAIVSPMKGSATGFPLARSLDVKNGDKTTVDKMFESSDSSLATSKLNSPEVNPNDPQNKKGPMTIAAAGSYNSGKPNSAGRFVVIGSSQWAANSFLGFNGNRDLALNTMNWLASDEDLISIRPKENDDRRITMTTAQLMFVRTTSQFLFPLGVIVAGVLVWWRRR
jgi:ABC-type uncharacterized transport system involved in gliding motility auxiliary subunit